ncbi:hypothetical protein D9758_017707 [Tetrapyrgos nigripes]|uniref:DUF659 domain-containing protein n=1 Tax=Tetrapyrgos nigripes TaxID=182062 RepID=A0A8H5FHC4_9AGAR|nr:hypothetical protein D9758_017707 [Tetrapyrgos nigripes]
MQSTKIFERNFRNITTHWQRTQHPQNIPQNMARTKGEIWDYFYQTPNKPNGTHHCAYCLGCIRKLAPDNVGANEDLSSLNGETWFQNILTQVTSVLGEKKAMVAHILGGTKPCRSASEKARKTAEAIRKGDQRKKRKGNVHEESGEEADKEDNDKAGPASSKRRKVIDRVELRQTELKVFKGISVPFTEEQKLAIHAQFLRASASANISFEWVDDPEVIKLFLMFRSAAGDVIPSSKVLRGRILNEEFERVENELKEELKDQKVTVTSDGVKDISKNSITGISVSAKLKPHLIDLLDTTADKKDGQSMCESFEKMVDSVEKDYGCRVVALGTDNDGGSRAGRELLGSKRPWLFVFPCGAHQGQLVLADYFKIHAAGNQTAEEATGVIGWLNNHGPVRKIFDEGQIAQNQKALAYATANMTHWTTHQAAFRRLQELQQNLRKTAFNNRDGIIAAQIGATGSKSNTEIEALRSAAEEQLDLLEDLNFWRRLSELLDDIEPIAYATNICQSDAA